MWNNDLWYALPLLISISLVYAATRREDRRDPPPALRMAAWIVGFMAVIFVVLQALSWCV